MYERRFQKQLYDESVIAGFEVPTKSFYKGNDDRPFYATQYQDNFIQYHEGLNFF